MSGHPHAVHLPPPEKLSLAKFPLGILFAGLSLFGIILSIIGAICNHVQFAYSWFFAFYYFFTIALGSFFWVTLHYACDSDWSVVVRRTWENILGLLPVLFVLFIPLCWPDFAQVLWQWMSPAADQHEVQIRSGYLNPTFFYLRVAAYFFYFILAGLYYRRNSVAQDEDGNPILTRRMHDHSYLALVIFGVLETFIGFDWYMGLDWRWSSSLFGVYNFALSAQASMAAGIVLVLLFRAGGHLKMIHAEHFYLMGKLLFGFTIFWAYIAFGQYLLIWYGNIPEETIFYNDHNRGHWYYLTYFIIVGKFMFPAIYLLAQDTKKSLRALTFISVWILFMHGIEMYWFIMPYAHARLLPSWQDVVAFLTVGSILGYFYVRLAAKDSLFPTRDPRLVECLTVTN
ncbi:MAG: hypothetical protein LV480_09210 [Methylacidiphilales bacterium]|nr:hypothetical protein [Candidatus Methylacidiphilales bacterium]